MSNAAAPFDDADPRAEAANGGLSRRRMLLAGGAMAAGLAVGARRPAGFVDDPIPGVPVPHGPGRSLTMPVRRGRKGFRPRPPYPLGKAIGAISIPALGVNDRLYEGIDLWVLDGGPGHWPGTPLPGQPGNSVIAGHRVSHSRPFRYLDTLRNGDVMVLSALGLDHVYTANNSFIVEPTAVSILGSTDESTATIFACHPPGSIDFRYVVTFVKVNETTA